jgi:FMN phosphatase YigB (HAD superfamily)
MTDLILVSDFDGTLYRGDGPVRHYAGLIAAQLPPAEAEAYLAAFERYLAQGPAAAADSVDLVEAAALRESVDGWGAAVQLGRRVHRLGPDAVSRAFAETREHMVETDLDLEPATALIDAFRQLRGRVRLLLATNSPLPGVDVLLGRLGAADLFDEVAGSLGKPDGLRRLFAAELGTVAQSAPAPAGRPFADPWRLLSVGDHWRNEIEPAVEIGAAAGYIDRFGRGDGPASVTVRAAEQLLPAVFAWADHPRQFTDPARPA